jgi:hypothetical protein
MHFSYEDFEKAAAVGVTTTQTDFGQPDAAREAIVWTETVLGRGFDLLQLAANQRKGGGWPDPAISESADKATADLAQLPLFGFAARLADLSIMGAGSDGFRTVEAHGAFGGWIAPYIAYLLSLARHHAAILWRPAASGEREAPASLVLAAATPPQYGVPPLLIAPGAAYGASIRDKMLVGDVPFGLIDRLHAAAARRPEESLCAIVAISSARNGELGDLMSVGDAVISFKLGSRAPELLDAAARLDEANRSGITVNSSYVPSSKA